MADLSRMDDVAEKGEIPEGNTDDFGLEAEPKPRGVGSTATAAPEVLGRQSGGAQRSMVNCLRALLQQFPGTQSRLTKKAEKEFQNTITVRKIEDYPRGYPRLAVLLDSDENFMLYRRFGFLQARVLLYKQDELRALEDELDDLDRKHEKDEPSWLLSREKDDVLGGKRKQLISQIEEKFKDYGTLLTTARDIMSFSRPPDRDYISVRRYFDQQWPTCNAERYIECKEDLITLRPGRESAWLDTMVEKVLQKLYCGVTRYIFCSPELRAKTDPKVYKVRLYSLERIDMAVSIIITATILALLIVPVWFLFHLTQGTKNEHTIAMIIMILLVCTLGFSATLYLFTRAKRHEILASAAAYFAVLVVFIGNIGPVQNTTCSCETSG